MKKQSLLIVLCLALLTACPAEQNTNGDPSSDASTSELASPQAPPPALEPVEVFPTEHIACCWEALSALDANYPALTLDAYNGKTEALQELLKLTSKMDLYHSYGHGATLADILNHVGDQRFAQALIAIASDLVTPNPNFEAEPLKYTLRNSLEGGFSLNEAEEIRKQSLINFPLSSAQLNYTVKKE